MSELDDRAEQVWEELENIFDEALMENWSDARRKREAKDYILAQLKEVEKAGRIAGVGDVIKRLEGDERAFLTVSQYSALKTLQDDIANDRIETIKKEG